jgi:purine-binding chemotaxis protein CheW
MSAEQSYRQIVVFTLGEEEYAFPIAHVHEIIRRTQPRSVASPDPWVRGIISLRGRIVPVHDLATRLGVAGGASEDWKIVILEVEGEVAGVIVDDVEEVLTVSDEQLESLPVGADGAVGAVVNLGDRLVAMLDSSLVFSGEQIAEVQAAAAHASAAASAPAAPAVSATPAASAEPAPVAVA